MIASPETRSGEGHHRGDLPPGRERAAGEPYNRAIAGRRGSWVTPHTDAARRGPWPRHEPGAHYERPGYAMILVGLILLIIGILAGISILWTIGVILIVIGAVLWILGAVGHSVGGRRHYW